MKPVLFLMFMTLSVQAVADDTYFCTKGVQERTIEVVYKTVDQVPCEVRYTKSGGETTETKVLWQANVQVGYCEEKAKAFAKKQQTFGWSCTGLD